MKPRYLGMPGHFIGASRCVWHLTTVVGGYIVSTVGDYRPFAEDQKPTEIGFGRTFETMVFRAGKPCARPECMCFAPYNTAGEAQAGHEAMVAKYVRLVS